MTDADYVLASLIWTVYGFTMGFGLGFLARLVWTTLNRR
jgi:hypothetical protein